MYGLLRYRLADATNYYLIMAKTLKLLDGLCWFLSPIALIFFFLSFLLLVIYSQEHPNLVRRLEAEGYVAQGDISHIYDDGDLYVEFIDFEGKQRSEIIDMTYYSDAVKNDIVAGAQRRVRYLYYSGEGVVLEDHFDAVRNYKKPLDALWVMFITSWIVIVIRPDWLYFGFTDEISLLGDSFQPEAQNTPTA